MNKEGHQLMLCPLVLLQLLHLLRLILAQYYPCIIVLFIII